MRNLTGLHMPPIIYRTSSAPFTLAEHRHLIENVCDVCERARVLYADEDGGIRVHGSECVTCVRTFVRSCATLGSVLFGLTV